MPVSNNIIRGGDVTPLRNNIMVYGMNFGERTTAAGIVLPGDDGRERGVRPRWAKVYSVGPKQKDVVPGDWVLVAHGRWTRAFKFEIDGKMEDLRAVDPADVLGSQTEAPDDNYVAESFTNIF